GLAASLEKVQAPDLRMRVVEYPDARALDLQGGGVHFGDLAQHRIQPGEGLARDRQQGGLLANDTVLPRLLLALAPFPLGDIEIELAAECGQLRQQLIFGLFLIVHAYNPGKVRRLGYLTGPSGDKSQQTGNGRQHSAVSTQRSVLELNAESCLLKPFFQL